MKLYHSPTSPYARKARAVIAEKALGGLVDEIQVDVYADPAELVTVNPLGRIPLLITDEGMALFDSPVICAYLDSHPAGKGAPLIPLSGAERWQVMRGEAFGDGLMDIGLDLTNEKRKPEGEKSPTLKARRLSQLERALDMAHSFVIQLPEAFNMGHITIVCALGYLDLRHDEIGWRNGRNDLAAWYAQSLQRACLASTTPT